MRAFVRGRESGLLVIAALIGVASGALVAAMSAASQKMHEFFFHIPKGAFLSVTVVAESWRVLAIPTLGGALIAALALWAGDRFRGRLADAIEANALHGGRLSARGSLYISLQTLVSNGFGASVGLEAAYTQMCGMIASLVGRGLGARRVDMRLLVGCGAAGAIAAAFDAPLAGAFYAFEAILGAYNVSSLMPIAASAVAATAVADLLLVHRPILERPAGVGDDVDAGDPRHIDRRRMLGGQRHSHARRRAGRARPRCGFLSETVAAGRRRPCDRRRWR